MARSPLVNIDSITPAKQKKVLIQEVRGEEVGEIILVSILFPSNLLNRLFITPLR
jgi:hypothetical protein